MKVKRLSENTILDVSIAPFKGNGEITGVFFTHPKRFFLGQKKSLSSWYINKGELVQTTSLPENSPFAFAYSSEKMSLFIVNSNHQITPYLLPNFDRGDIYGGPKCITNLLCKESTLFGLCQNGFSLHKWTILPNNELQIIEQPNKEDETFGKIAALSFGKEHLILACNATSCLHSSLVWLNKEGVKNKSLFEFNLAISSMSILKNEQEEEKIFLVYEPNLIAMHDLKTSKSTFFQLFSLPEQNPILKLKLTFIWTPYILAYRQSKPKVFIFNTLNLSPEYQLNLKRLLKKNERIIQIDPGEKCKKEILITTQTRVFKCTIDLKVPSADVERPLKKAKMNDS